MFVATPRASWCGPHCVLLLFIDKQRKRERDVDKGAQRCPAEDWPLVSGTHTRSLFPGHDAALVRLASSNVFCRRVS